MYLSQNKMFRDHVNLKPFDHLNSMQLPLLIE